MVARVIAGHLARTARRWVGVGGGREERKTLTRNSRVFNTLREKKRYRFPVPPSIDKRFPIHHSNLGGKDRNGLLS